MRTALLALPVLLMAAQVAAAQGLRLDRETSNLKARVQLLAGDDFSGSRLLGAQLLGDYYLIGQGNGLRVSGGLMVGPASLLASGSTPLNSGLLGVGMRRLAGNTSEGSVNQPYLGLGYSHDSSDWRFSADLGVAMGGSLRLGRSNGFSQSLDESLRRLQLTPMLQLGVSYRF
jgi:hypothetical protein